MSWITPFSAKAWLCSSAAFNSKTRIEPRSDVSDNLDWNRWPRMLLKLLICARARSPTSRPTISWALFLIISDPELLIPLFETIFSLSARVVRWKSKKLFASRRRAEPQALRNRCTRTQPWCCLVQVPIPLARTRALLQSTQPHGAVRVIGRKRTSTFHAASNFSLIAIPRNYRDLCSNKCTRKRVIKPLSTTPHCKRKQVT